MNSVAVLLFLLLFWWLLRKWTRSRWTHTQGNADKRTRERPGNNRRRQRAADPPDPDSDAQQLKDKVNAARYVDSVLRRNDSAEQASPVTELPPSPAETGNIEVDFNRIEIDNSHARPSLFDPAPQSRAMHRPQDSAAHSALEPPPQIETGLPPEEQDSSAQLHNKITYLEKQIHENNRDITMLSDQLAQARQASRATRRQHETALRAEKDRVLFFETRLQTEIEKLVQIEARLLRKGLSLDRFLELINGTEELEREARLHRHEISRLNDLLSVALGYRSGSNKRNQELDMLRRQSNQIAQLEARLALKTRNTGKKTLNRIEGIADIRQAKEKKDIAGSFSQETGSAHQ